MNVSVKPFGLGDAQLFTLENDNGMSVRISDFGGCIINLMVPDKNGIMGDVVLAQQSPKAYETNSSYLGALIGRTSNRIAGAKVDVEGVAYDLPKNEGENMLHSGAGCLAFRQMDSVAYVGEGEAVLRLYTIIPHLEDGFPGNFTVEVEYYLNNDNILGIEYSASSDKATVINMTNHAYFNLGGHDSGTVEEHILQMNAPFFTPIDSNLLPTGELLSTKGTSLDFQGAKPVGEGIHGDHPQTMVINGIDHNFVLEGEGLRRVATLTDPASGRVMHTYTDQPGVQVYTANSPLGIGKDGVDYKAYSGICLETQNAPDGVHMPWMKSSIYGANEDYYSVTEYRFETM